LTGSTFGWLDHSEQQRREMLEVVNLFREKGTVDELGAGVVRDAFADHFFPGTSTLHTRAKYMLFVPWIFLKLEHERVPSAQFDRRARQEQARLVRALMAGGESEGVIGIDAGANILRPPALLYWGGLRSLGILRYTGSYESYMASRDGHHRVDHSLMRSDDGELIDEAPRAWHGGLPHTSDDFGQKTTFILTREEADYLRERIVTERRDSLFAAFVASSASVARIYAAWFHPEREALSSPLRSDLADAERFSLITQGAYLLYNLMLAQASVANGWTGHARRVEEYADALAKWDATMTGHDHMRGWTIDRVWQVMARTNQRIPIRTRHFFDVWTDLALNHRSGLAENETARHLIRKRERELKGGLARLENPRALENWGGASSTGRLDFRWGNVRTVLRDIHAGLRSKEAADA
jgi:hypothetical protein